jgi:hypothetical protein
LAVRRVLMGKVPFIGISEPCPCRFGREREEWKIVELAKGQGRRAVWRSLVIGILRKDFELSERTSLGQKAEKNEGAGDG